ncbi:MAG TPA: hypothetical protein PLB38_01875 [bacterium]|nr:hypothetical protein [bacterium]
MPETFSELTAFKVAGYRHFAENNWKQALAFFLNGVWSGEPKIMRNPQFYFAVLEVNLCLNKKTRVYYLDCPPGDCRILCPRPIFSEAQICVCFNQQLDVEEALKIFINRRTCRMLEFWLVPKKLFLWRDDDEFLHCQVDDISVADKKLLRKI